MAKTRSRARNAAIKKEEEENSKPTLCLGKGAMTPTTRKPSKLKNRPLPVQQVKVEEHSDTKALLKSGSSHSKRGPTLRISQEQINQLIHYIVNDNMSVYGASRKVKMFTCPAYYYYKLYKNDPEKRIPLPQDQTPKVYMQEQIGNLIRYINDDKMSIREASAKANMSRTSGSRYYNKYMKDPNNKIPVPQFQQNYTQDQMNEFINYIINDKMSIAAASKKAKMNRETANSYYHKYFEVQNPDIARPSHIVTPKCYTQEQINELVGYIVDDKMSIKAASRKANFNPRSAGSYYRQYLIDNNMEIPVSKMGKRYTQDEINELLRCIVDDKMTVKAASKKANMNVSTGFKYYSKYLTDHNLYLRPPKCAQDQINELIRYIVDDKISIAAASKKANMSLTTAYKYYRQYRKDHNIDLPIPKIYTQEQKSELIGYIVHDKMSIRAASKKANVGFNSGLKYYHRYLNAQKCSGPT